MRRVYAFCEGLTEQRFCEQVLQPHLFPSHEGLIHTVRVANSWRRGVAFRGGLGSYAALRKDIRRHLAGNSAADVVFTTLLDLYGLPDDFPGSVEAAVESSPRARVALLEREFGQDIGDWRLLPHIQLHEFETLLFAQPAMLGSVFDDCNNAVAALERVAGEFGDVELIDAGRDTAPSKRIIAALPAFEGRKPTAGPDVVEAIGVARLREACRHFDAWLGELEVRLWGS
jgi:hypothetical protein